MTTDSEPPRRWIRFAGRRWWVKWASDPMGPGPNRFDDSTESVEVHADGSLSLRVRRVGGRWMCAEVVGEEATGSGRYEWTVRTDVRHLERHVVCGMFTYSGVPASFHREIDIEVSAWSGDDGVGGQFVVQPSECDGHCGSFGVPRTVPWSCSFDWAPTGVTFRAAGGQPWTFTGDGVPPPGSAHPRINLWLHTGAAPPTNTDVAVRFDDFRFTPQGT